MVIRICRTTLLKKVMKGDLENSRDALILTLGIGDHPSQIDSIVIVRSLSLLLSIVSLTVLNTENLEILFPMYFLVET